MHALILCSLDRGLVSVLIKVSVHELPGTTSMLKWIVSGCRLHRQMSLFAFSHTPCPAQVLSQWHYQWILSHYVLLWWTKLHVFVWMHMKTCHSECFSFLAQDVTLRQDILSWITLQLYIATVRFVNKILFCSHWFLSHVAHWNENFCLQSLEFNANTNSALSSAVFQDLNFTFEWDKQMMQ